MDLFMILKDHNDIARYVHLRRNLLKSDIHTITIYTDESLPLIK